MQTLASRVGQKQNVVLFAIDEPIVFLSADFREDYHKYKSCASCALTFPFALTATATPPVLKDMVAQLLLKKPDHHVHGFYRPNLFYQVEICSSDEMKFKILCQALRDVPEGRVLIYCGTRQLCQDLTQTLKKEFKGVAYYHAGLDTEKRQEIQEKLDAGRLRILAATNAFGMGIDYPNVRLVVRIIKCPPISNRLSKWDALTWTPRAACFSTRKDKGASILLYQQSTASDFVIRRRWVVECHDSVCEGGSVGMPEF